MAVGGLVGAHHRQFLVVVIECSESYGRANLVDSLGLDYRGRWCGYPLATTDLTAVGLWFAEVDRDSICQVGQFGGIGLRSLNSRLNEFDCLLLERDVEVGVLGYEPCRRTAVSTDKVMSGPPVLGDVSLRRVALAPSWIGGSLVPGGRPSPVRST